MRNARPLTTTTTLSPLSMLYIDSREKKQIQQRVHGFLKVHKVESWVKALPVGDYSWTAPHLGEVVVETKTVDDFLSSLTSGRMRRQVLKLREVAHPFLAVIGTCGTNDAGHIVSIESGRESGWTTNSINAIILRYKLEGIHYEAFMDRDTFERWLLHLYTVSMKGKPMKC